MLLESSVEFQCHHLSGRLERTDERTERWAHAHPGTMREAAVCTKDPRCVIVHSRAASDGALLVAVARRIAHRLPEPYQSRLLAAGSEKRPLAECAAEDMWRELKPSFDARCAEVDAFLSDHNLKGVDCLRLIGVPLHTMESALRWLNALGITNAKIATHPHLMWRSVDTLQEKRAWLHGMGIKDAKIATHPALLSCTVDTLHILRQICCAYPPRALRG